MNDFYLTINLQSLNDPICQPQNLHYTFSKQYERDSFLYKEDGDFLLFIGVCHNKTELFPTSAKNWPENMFFSFKASRKSLLEHLSGYFCGLYYDAKNRDVVLFSDHLTTIPVYYYRHNNFFVVDTNLFRLAQELRRLGQPIQLSEFGAYAMLTYSFMLDNYTLLADVYKVRPASIYSFRDNRTEKYFEFYSDEKQTLSKDSIAEGIDYHFSQSIRDSFSLDNPNSHLLTLSGGLDSRMCLFYALKCGFQNITTLNYSQSFYREELIAKKIATDYHCEHIFFSLDNGRYLSNIDEGICATQGMTTSQFYRLEWCGSNFNLIVITLYIRVCLAILF